MDEINKHKLWIIDINFSKLVSLTYVDFTVIGLNGLFFTFVCLDSAIQQKIILQIEVCDWQDAIGPDSLLVIRRNRKIL